MLTYIAEGVASLAARVDAMEAANAVHQAQVNEALATIAEIATRTYYASNPPNALPDDVINANVIDAMIERWPSGAVIGMSSQDRQLLSELDRHPIEAIDLMITRAQDNPDQSNANRLRMDTILALLNREKDRRAKVKAQGIERDGLGRGRYRKMDRFLSQPVRLRFALVPVSGRTYSDSSRFSWSLRCPPLTSQVCAVSGQI